MPMITPSHFFALSSGIRPGNAVLNGLAVAPHVFASALAMSTSKPLIAPLEEASSIGGNDGSVQNVNVVARFAAPTVPAIANAIPITAMEMIALRIPPSWSLVARGRSLSPPGPVDQRRGVEREQVECDVRRRESGRLPRPVVGRSDLDDVAAREPDTAERTEQGERLRRRETRDLGCPGARRERWIEEVDVEREEDGQVADLRPHDPCVALRAERAKFLARDDGEAECS